MANEPETWRHVVFKYRGTLLALPAASLALRGIPTRSSMALGVPLALCGEALRCWAVGYSGVTTRADHVTAQALTTAGPYAYVRNPLYVGNVITALGFTFAFTGGLDGVKRIAFAILGLGTMLGVYAAIVPLEERYLRETFGAAFDAYAQRVPRLIPRASAAQPQAGTYDRSVIASAETRTFITFAVMLAALAVRARATAD